jgi:DHA1 family tetracycline resistance protein-like MFS transporter
LVSGLRIPAGFDRDVRLLTASMFARRIVMGFLGVVRALYFAYLGYTAVEIGLLLSVATGVSAIQNVTFGYLCDRYGRKPFLVLGAIFAALRMVIFAVSTDFWMLALGQGFGALGEGVGAGQPVVSGYITDKVETKDRPGVYSGIAITNSVAATIGSALAGLPVYLQASQGLGLVQAHQVLWWACAAISALSLLMVLPLRESSRRVEASAEPKAPGRLNWGAITRFSLIRGTNGLAWGLADSLTPLYLFYRFGVGSDALGPVYAFARLLSVFSYLALSRIVDRFGDIHTLIVSRVASAVLTLAFALAGSYPVAVGLLVVNRLVTLFSMPIRQTFASGFVDPEETATAIGVSSFARMGAQTVAPTLAGYMFEALSLSTPFMVGASLMAVNGALYWVFFRPGEDQAALAEAG